MATLNAWLQASRLPSQTYIAFPILAGQMVAYAAGYRWSWAGFLFAQLFGLFDQLYIVYANDWADVETDLHNETYNMFSGGSRVIVEGKISRRAIGAAAIVMVVLALATGGAMWALTGGPTPLLLVIAGLLLLWAYSYKPFHLSYRGAGELLQMAGVGAVLPLIGFVAQGGSLLEFPWVILTVSLPISLACAVATSLPDEPSDRRSRKRTGSVVLGPNRAQRMVIALASLSFAAWMLVPSTILPATGARALALVVPAAFWLWAAVRVGGLPGSARLTSFVTLMVASNVTFFLALSVALAVA